MAFNTSFKFVRAADGGLPMIRSYKEASSESFVAGDLVYLSSGAVTVCADDATVIMGIAMKAATSVTTGHTDIPVLVIRPGDEFAVRTTSGATLTACTTANVGIPYGVELISAGSWGVDTGSGSADAFIINRILYDPDGTQMGYWVQGTFYPNALQYSRTNA